MLVLPRQNPFKIIHIDMDCFYAAVEMRDNPKLRNIPIAIGANVRRGVLCTSNYEARKYGVRSAMPSSTALKLCPHLTFVRPDFKKYKEVAGIIREIFYQFSDKVEPLSLDEAYIDVTESERYFNSATLMAKEIRRLIYKETSLTASAGVAPNKFLAKIASDWNKPNNQFTIDPKEVLGFCEKLELRKISGVGKVTDEKLKSLGLSTCGDLRNLSPEKMRSFLGKFGPTLFYRSYGIDNRELELSRVAKTLSVETTFSFDKNNITDTKDSLDKLIGELQFRYAKHKKKNPETEVKGLGVKIKLNNFQSSTMEKTFDFNPENYDQIKEISQELLQITHSRNPLPFRLIGVGLKFKSTANNFEKQLTLL